MRLFARLKSWLRPDPADALKGAEGESFDGNEWDEPAAIIAVETLWTLMIPAVATAAIRAATELTTPQHPNNQPLADPSSGEDAAPVPDDLHDV